MISRFGLYPLCRIDPEWETVERKNLFSPCGLIRVNEDPGVLTYGHFLGFSHSEKGELIIDLLI